MKSNFEKKFPGVEIEKGVRIELPIETLLEQFVESIEPETKGQKFIEGKQFQKLNAKETAELAIRILTHKQISDEGVKLIENNLDRIKYELLSNLSEEEAQPYIDKINNLLERRE